MQETGLASRGSKRFERKLPLEPPFTADELTAAPLVLAVVTEAACRAQRGVPELSSSVARESLAQSFVVPTATKMSRLEFEML